MEEENIENKSSTERGQTQGHRPELNQSPLSLNERISIWLPLLLAFMLAFGVMIGLGLRSGSKSPSIGKIEEILGFINARYLESVDLKKLEDAAVEGLLKELDPHSAYIPASKLQGVKESLQGNFEGIGVEFFMLDDTIMVLGVIPDGPSFKAGIRAGDRIIRVDDSLVAGVGLKNETVIKKIKGVAGSKVKIQVIHRAESTPVNCIVKRAEIPMKSVETAYMLDDKTGYIKISRFSGQTFEEFMKSLEELTQKKSMKNLIIDLRNNPGGYLNEATDILNQLFEDKRLLVYTEGRSFKRKEYKSAGKPYFNVGKIAILINEGSASASEILAGAIQDNDRGIIIGRRSFGKGLVQEQYDLSDYSAIRLTVAKYYTPSGRLIQKPYQVGEEEAYDEDTERRYLNGEMLHRDSIKVKDSTVYKTVGGRVVYGGGGIIPDIFVPIDSITHNNYFLNLNLFVSDFAYRYLDSNLSEFVSYKNAQSYAETFEPGQNMMQRFYDYACKKGNFPKNDKIWSEGKKYLSQSIKAQIGQQLFREEGLYRSLNKNDKDLIKAIEELNRVNKGKNLK
jgi:carboxyl-terminal processing protease